MENKDAHLIRKYMNLMESIENNLIVENESTDINEDLLSTAAREGKLIASELEGFLKTMKQDSKVAAELTKLGIRDSEELLRAITANKLSSSLKGSLELSILKSQTTNAKLIDLASENLARNQQFLQKYSNEIKQGQPQFEAALKRAGYSDRAITKIVEKAYLKKPSGLQTVGSKQKDAQNIIDAGNQRRAINYNPKTGKWTITTQRLADKLKASKEGKILASNNKSLIEKIKNLFKSDAKLITDAGGVKQWKISKKLLALGLAAGGAAVLYYLFSTKGDGSDVELVDNSDKPIDPNLVNNWAPCIQDLIKNKSGVISTSESGEVTVSVSKTGNDEYDKLGGVRFYSNGRVWSNDNSKKGNWKCKGGEAVMKEMVNEQSSEVSATELQKGAKELDDQLSGDFFEGDSTDMQDTLEIIKKFENKTYRGKNAIEVLKDVYKKVSGSDLLNDVKTKLKNLDFVGTEAQSDAISILSSSSGGGTTSGGGIGNIDITWDEVKSGGGSDGGGKKEKKSLYHNCENIPFVFGCVSPKIVEIQKCLGMDSKYQTGNFGPLTKTAIENWGKENNFDLSYVFVGEENAVRQLVIDQKTYDAIMSKCGAKKTDTEKTDTTKGGETPKEEPIKTDTPIATTPTPTTPTTSTEEPKGETPDELYERLYRSGYLVKRLNGRRVVYKGPDLTKEEQGKLTQYMESKGYRLSRYNNDFRKGDKMVFKRNKAGYPESQGPEEEPSPVDIETGY